MVKIYAAPSLHEHRCFSSTISYQKQTKILWIIDHHTAWLPLICQILSVFNSPHVYWLSTRQPVQLIKKKILCHFWLWSEWEYHLTLFTTSFFFFYIYIFMHTSYNNNYWCSRYDACWWCMPYLMLNNSLLYWERCHCDQSCQITLDISRSPIGFQWGPRNIQGNLDRWSWWWWWWSINSRTADVHQTVVSKI